jgi:hypothetical protein
MLQRATGLSRSLVNKNGNLNLKKHITGEDRAISVSSSSCIKTQAFGTIGTIGTVNRQSLAWLQTRVHSFRRTISYFSGPASASVTKQFQLSS